MRRMLLPVAVIVLAAALSGCGAPYHREQVANTDKDRISAGTVQREIRVGMSSADVIQVMGSPNIVTTDEQRRQVWVWDKVATEQAYSKSSGGVMALILGGGMDPASGVVGGGAGGGSFSSASGASSTTQRTLTIIVKFDENDKVRDFAYRQSSF